MSVITVSTTVKVPYCPHCRTRNPLVRIVMTSFQRIFSCEKCKRVVRVEDYTPKSQAA